MANVSITAASVLRGANAKVKSVQLAATVTAGQPLYRVAASGLYDLADANVSAALATVAGIALSGGAANQWIDMNEEDDNFTPGFTLVLGGASDDGIYVLSATAGAIAPVTDLAAAMYPVILMVAKTTSTAVLKIINGGGVLV